MPQRKLTYLLGLPFLLLLGGLVYQISFLPSGLVLPGYFLGAMYLAVILTGCLILAGIAKLIFKRAAFLHLFLVFGIGGFLFFHYQLYSPPLTVVVPKGYTGEVTLVLSNVDKDILRVDSNGIGYLSKSTFDRTYREPVVIDRAGRNLNPLCVGFNPTNFWAHGTSGSSQDPEGLTYLSFEIAPKERTGQRQYFYPNRWSLVDSTKLYKRERGLPHRNY
jgi:hypothetical protein